MRPRSTERSGLGVDKFHQKAGGVRVDHATRPLRDGRQPTTPAGTIIDSDNPFGLHPRGSGRVPPVRHRQTPVTDPPVPPPGCRCYVAEPRRRSSRRLATSRGTKRAR